MPNTIAWRKRCENVSCQEQEFWYIEITFLNVVVIVNGFNL